MKRMLWAALVALPALVPSSAQAQQPGCSNCGPTIAPPLPASYAPHAAGRPDGWHGKPGGPFGCGGFCLRFFGTWLQDGPLVNYGPYEGYYPFEPYGPWTSDLRYTGPTTRPRHGGGFGGAGNCHGGNCGGGLGLFNRKACGDYSLATFRNVFQRLNPGCGSCGF